MSDNPIIIFLLLFCGPSVIGIATIGSILMLRIILRVYHGLKEEE
jgi:hypothetical protein